MAESSGASSRGEDGPRPKYPSLDQIRHEVDVQVQDQERRGNGFDTKAGLLLALCGVLIGLAPGEVNLLQVLGRFFAGIAAFAAIYAMFPRISGAIDPRALRNKYLTTDAEITRLRVLDTRISLFEQDEKRMANKVARLKVAVFVLAIAVVLLFAGYIVSAVTEGGGDHDQQEQGFSASSSQFRA